MISVPRQMGKLGCPDTTTIRALFLEWAAEAESRPAVTSPQPEAEDSDEKTAIEATCTSRSGRAGAITGLHVTCQLLTGATGAIGVRVTAPPSCEGATVERLWLIGDRKDGEGLARVAVSPGKITEGTASLDLTRQAARNCPIRLEGAAAVSADIKLRPWTQRLLDRVRQIAVVVEAAVLAPMAPAPGVVYGLDNCDLAAFTAGESDGHPFERVVESRGLRARLWRTETGHCYLQVTTETPLGPDELVYFALMTDAGEGEPVFEGYAAPVAPPGAPVSAMFRVETIPADAELCLALVAKEAWGAVDLPLLEWSSEHAGTATLEQALEALLAQARAQTTVADESAEER